MGINQEARPFVNPATQPYYLVRLSQNSVQLMQPEKVFTPRNHEVNSITYVTRSEHEAELIRALNSNRHVIVSGLSGSGKSWLYKSVFDKLDIHFDSINLADVGREGSINSAIEFRLNDLGVEKEKASVITVEGGFSPGGVGGKVSRTDSKAHYRSDVFSAYLRFLQLRSNKERIVIVLENFERIAERPNLVRQLSDLLILLDDPSYAQFNSKFLIVGALSQILQLIGSDTNASTIKNRTVEISEVGRLTEDETFEIIQKGFDKLQFKILADQFHHYISWLTDRNAQHVQELCLAIASVSARDGIVTSDNLKTGINNWIQEHLRSDYDSILSHVMHENASAEIKRTIYAIGQVEYDNITPELIGEILVNDFSDSAEPILLAQHLRQLSKGAHPLIHRERDRSYFRLARPSYRMILRSTIVRESNGEVRVLNPVVQIDAKKKKYRIERPNLSEIMLGPDPSKIS